MAACGSLGRLIERARPENPTLVESLSWSQIDATKHAKVSSSSSAAASFTDMFGELHFDEKRSSAWPPQPDSASPRCPSRGDARENEGYRGEGVLPLRPSLGSPNTEGGPDKRVPGENGVVPRMRRSESLQLCTEGIGSESSDVMEDPKAGPGGDWIVQGGGAASFSRRQYSRTLSGVQQRSKAEFPPPISCIGSGGKPWVSFRSYREGGRFVLRKVKIPNQELLSASREDGRLKLRFVHPDEEAKLEEEEGRGRDEEGGDALILEKERDSTVGEGNGAK